MPLHYIDRLQKLSKSRSLFVFGARNTGKSTLVEQTFSAEETLFIDLLDPKVEAQFSRDPSALYDIVETLPAKIKYVAIDEIQKVPKLLDVVHRLMKNKKRFFIMTGSSARKLKAGGANLLAGRAFVYDLFPYSFMELGKKFNLNEALHWGLLPEIMDLKSNKEKEDFLYAYAHTYLKEEVWEEQFISELDPFRHFLEVAAQSNGKIVNFANIAKDVGVNDKTVKSYYSILEDTLIGFFLESHQNSFRKRLSSKPKFYFFDMGVVRCLNRQISSSLVESTKAYGDAFEHFIILEIMKLAKYFERDYRFSYIRTKDDAEVDLVIDRPRKPLLCIEIKSSEMVSRSQINSFITLTKSIPNSEAICLSRDKFAKKYDHVLVLPWRDGIKEIFGIE